MNILESVQEKMFKKIKVNIKDGKLRRICFLNFSLFLYGKYDGKKFCSFNIKKIINKQSDKPIFYLKVNRNIEDTILCLQRWIDIINDFNADFYILCDNEGLKDRILKNVTFYSPDIKFIKSKRNVFQKILNCQKIASNWVNAACAHLSVFEHANSINASKYWNVDADDSLFLIDNNKVIEILNNAENYAETNNLDLFSFDFWATKTKGIHWSFGITFQRNTKNYFDLLNKYIINWNDYKNYTSVHNIDWVFTFLKNSQTINAKSFYVENLYFIHFGRFFSDLKNANIAYWNNGKMYWPIWAEIFKDSRGIMNIPNTEDIVKFSLLIEKDECLNFAIKHLVGWTRLPLMK